MKIKRFFATEMREAIRQVKAELGADAVILSNNKVDGGIELVAAIDYDEEAVHRSIEQQANIKKPVMSKSKVASISEKKRSVFAKVKKQPVKKSSLIDSIEDDVISFSGQQPANLTTSQAATQHSNRFAEVLKQSAPPQQPDLNNRHDAIYSEAQSNGAYSKPSMADRKQPFISDFVENDFAENDVTKVTDDEDSYPFDYESLVKEEQKRIQKQAQVTEQHRKADTNDFFSGNSKTNSNDGAALKSKNNKSSKVEWVQDPVLLAMQEEIKSMRGILENQMSGLAWGNFSRKNPHSAELLSRLYRLGIKSSLSQKIVKQIKNTETDSLEDCWRQTLSLIARNIPMNKGDLIDEGGIIALVGPTGVGKTTNIAKLAARFTLKYGAKNLALVTTDGYRIGAHEQLKTYGRILGVPVYIANDENELRQVLSRLDDKQLVLIDTAGMSHRDLRLAEQLKMLRHSHEQMKVLAVLSASTQTLMMDEVIKTFNANELDGCIASKVDESTSMGGIISILIENQLQINYISDGQKVPEDIHRAHTKDILKQALEMVRQHPVSVNNDELAISYATGGVAYAAG